MVCDMLFPELKTKTEGEALENGRILTDRKDLGRIRNLVFQASEHIRYNYQAEAYAKLEEAEWIIYGMQNPLRKREEPKIGGRYD
jgi:hypothetical protein